MEVNLGQKRDSILAQTGELKNEVKDKSDNVQVTSAKVRCSLISLTIKICYSVGNSELELINYFSFFLIN